MSKLIAYIVQAGKSETCGGRFDPSISVYLSEVKYYFGIQNIFLFLLLGIPINDLFLHAECPSLDTYVILFCIVCIQI